VEVDIDPLEKRDQHLKTYVERSVLDCVKQYQEMADLYSISEAARALIIMGLKLALP
jgi:hypothetical protein